VAAFHWRRPSAAEAAELGLKPSDYEEPVADLWPEHEEAFILYMQNHTQWRVGPGGVIGFDYSIYFREIDRLKLSEEDADEMMALIRMIEQSALAEIHKS
jgi:hypothetical protein